MIPINDSSLLTPSDLFVFHEFLNSPMESWRSISRRTGIHQRDIRGTYYKLKSQSLLRDDYSYKDPILGQRQKTEVEGLYDPPSLGLSRIHLLFDELSAFTLDQLRRVLHRHPYTHFITQCAGTKMSLYTQIDVPAGTEDLLMTFASEMAEISHCQFQALYDFTWRSDSYFDLKFLQQQRPNEMRLRDLYDFTGSSPMNSMLDQLWSDYKFAIDNYLETPDYSSITVSNVSRPDFDDLDLLLLRELTINPKISNKELSQQYEMNTSTLSKRMTRVKENFIRRYRLYFYHPFFNLSSYLISGNFSDSVIQAQELVEFVRSQVPFGGTIQATSDDYLWHFTTSQQLALDTFDFLHSHHLKPRLYAINPRTSFTFHFQPNNFDMGLGWKKSRSHMVEVPISMRSLSSSEEQKYRN